MAIKRVSEMESIMDQALRIMDNAKESPEVFLGFQSEIKKLEDYYSSQNWKDDFALDEKGMLPEELKRGVLSEDGIYDLLERNADLLERIGDSEHLRYGVIVTNNKHCRFVIARLDTVEYPLVFLREWTNDPEDGYDEYYTLYKAGFTVQEADEILDLLKADDMRKARTTLNNKFKEDGILCEFVGEVRLDDAVPDAWYDAWKEMETIITIRREHDSPAALSLSLPWDGKSTEPMECKKSWEDDGTRVKVTVKSDAESTSEELKYFITVECISDPQFDFSAWGSNEPGKFNAVFTEKKN